MIQLLLIGLVAGFSSGLLGIGGGVILVPALIFFLRLSVHQAVALSLAVIVPTALVGFLRHYQSLQLPISYPLYTAAGGIVGALIGAQLAITLDAELLKKIFGVFMLFVACHMLFDFGAPVPDAEVTGKRVTQAAESGDQGE